jgi:hypothetical protein
MNSAVTATRPLRATYANSFEGGTIEEVLSGPSTDPGAGAGDGDGVSAGADHPVVPESAELGAVIDEFMQAAEDGEAEDVRGEPYTTEGLKELDRSLKHVKSELGTMAIDAVRRRHVQGMLDELRRAGLAPGRFTAIVEALDSLYRYAILWGLVEDSPVIWLTVPQSTVRAPATRRRRPRADPDGAPTPTPMPTPEPVPTPEPLPAAAAAPIPAPAVAPAPPPTYAPAPTYAPPTPPPAPAPAPAVAPTPAATSAPGETPTSTQEILALGGRLMLWTVRVIVTIFVLVAIVLIVEFA